MGLRKLNDNQREILSVAQRSGVKCLTLEVETYLDETVYGDPIFTDEYGQYSYSGDETQLGSFLKLFDLNSKWYIGTFQPLYPVKRKLMLTIKSLLYEDTLLKKADEINNKEFTEGILYALKEYEETYGSCQTQEYK